LDKNTIGKGVAYLYVEAITMMFSGYMYWVMLSKITSPEVIGLSSSLVSLVAIFTVVASIGVPGGMQSYLGKSIVSNNKEKLNGIINSSLILIGCGIITTSLFIIILDDWIYRSFSIDPFYTLLIVLITGLSVLSGLLRAIIIPSMNTKTITISSILSTVLKISVTFVLVIFDYGVLGVLIGFIIYPMTSSLFLVNHIRKELYQKSKILNRDYLSSQLIFIKDILRASIAFWIPGIINIVGSQLGTVLVLFAVGASAAGFYFLSLSIVTGLSLIMSVLSTVAYPTISALSDGRKKATWRLIKISSLITVPLSNVLLLYASDLMSFFGSNYALSSSNLQILLLSILPTSFISGLGVLVYAYGKNNLVLTIGIFTSLPRIFLYLILAPMFGGNGASLAYLVGALTGATASIIIANKLSFRIVWSEILLIFAIPLVFTLIFKHFIIDSIMSIIIILPITYLLFSKLKILNSEDIQDISKILPIQMQNHLHGFFKKLNNLFKRH